MIDHFFIENDIRYSSIEAECFILKTYSLKFNKIKYVIYIILSILTLGLIHLISYWFVSLKCVLLYSTCSVDDATHFLILNSNNEYTLESVRSYGHQISFINR